MAGGHPLEGEEHELMAKWLGAREVAEMLSMSYDGALKLIKEAGAKKVRALVRIREDVLERYLDQCPDLAKDHDYSSGRAARAGTRISTGTPAMSALKPTISSKPRSTSPTLSTAEQLKALRRKRAS
jgi:hypothetical protein